MTSSTECRNRKRRSWDILPALADLIGCSVEGAEIPLQVFRLVVIGEEVVLIHIVLVIVLMPLRNVLFVILVVLVLAFLATLFARVVVVVIPVAGVRRSL